MLTVLSERPPLVPEQLGDAFEGDVGIPETA